MIDRYGERDDRRVLSLRSGEHHRIRGAELLSGDTPNRDNGPKLSIGKLILTKDIFWLLPPAQHAGSGVLSTVDYIQRLHTRGGVAQRRHL
jgi:hypothetical protein